MDVKIKGKEVIVTHKLRKNETYRVQKGSKIESIVFLKKPQVVSGYSNSTSDNMGILLMDYDNVNLNVIEEDYAFIQQKFKLPEGYLFKTGKGFHVLCFKKFPHSIIHFILLHTRVDENYKDMPLRNPYRSYVLRMSPKKNGKKPRYIGMIGNSNYRNSEVSSAHIALIKSLYPKIKIKDYPNSDNFSKIKLTMYETSA